MEEKVRCRLCGNEYPYEDMSEEHYPARSTGNDDIVAVNIVKLFDMFISGRINDEINKRLNQFQSFESVAEDIFDKELALPLYPKGRTARTLCRTCNSFLGKYDEAYKRFYNCDGDSKIVKGFQSITKLRIIKAIYGKFLSVPEVKDEEFDFIDFVRDESIEEYSGPWKIYFIRRDLSTDLMGLADIRTGSVEFEEGTVYELSDDKFIYNLMKFPKHDCFAMTDIFDICNKNYKICIGTGKSGGYHAQILMTSLFKDAFEKSEIELETKENL